MKDSKHENQTVILFKALADESRLKIISILMKQDSYSEYLASKLNLTAPTITYHMEKLVNANIVRGTKIQHYTIYSINKEIMNTQIGELVKSAIAIDDDVTYEKKVIGHFFEYGRLKKIPSQLKKREIVIGYIASKFELGKEYSEKQVVAEITAMHDDHCTIKRDLIGMGFFQDIGGAYKRIK